jgi:hypothetical protein
LPRHRGLDPHIWRRQLPFALIALIGSLEGCGATDVCACEIGSATAVLFETVTSPEGAGIPGARVRVEARMAPSCPAIEVHGEATTEAAGIFRSAGLYRMEVRGFEEATGVCLAVVAQPPLDSSGLSASPEARVVVDLAFPGAPDSVEVPLTLPR